MLCSGLWSPRRSARALAAPAVGAAAGRLTTRVVAVVCVSLGLIAVRVSPMPAQTASDSASPGDVRETVPLRRFRDGSDAFTTYSGLRAPVRRVVRDSADWRRVWDEINQPFFPRPALPPVNFAREMVIVAALGSRPTAGYDIAIEHVDRDTTGIEVSVRARTPAAGCPVEAAVTQPVDLARIPASRDSVRFREQAVVVPCSP